MSKLFRKLWADDAGAIITVEWILFVGIVLMGLIPAFAGLRNLLSSAVVALGNNAYVIGTTDWAYNGEEVVGQDTGSVVGSINGNQVIYAEEPLTRNGPGASPNAIQVTYAFAGNLPSP